MKAKEKVEYAKRKADRDHDACRYDAYGRVSGFRLLPGQTVLAVFDDYSSKLQDLLQNVSARESPGTDWRKVQPIKSVSGDTVQESRLAAKRRR